MLGVIGCLGKVPFICSHGLVMTFSNLKRDRRSRWAKHDVLGKKPTLEWVGEDLSSVSMDIRLDINLGVTPASALLVLEKMQASKEPHLLLIGGEIIGRYVISSVTENRKFHSGAGVCLVAEVSLSLTEWSGEVDDWANQAVGMIDSVLSPVSDAVAGVIGDVTGAIEGVAGEVKEAVGGVVNQATDAALKISKNAVGGVIGHIKGGAS